MSRLSKILGARRLWRRFVVLLVAMLGVLLLGMPLAAPAHAATQKPQRPQTGSDTVSLSLTNGTTFGYGQRTGPQFTAVVVFGVTPTENLGWFVSVRLENGETFGQDVSPAPGPNEQTLIFSRLIDYNLIPGGQHTAVASFHNLATGIVTPSNPVGFTITKANPGLTCGVAGLGHFVAINQSLLIGMSFNDNLSVPVDWKDATYSVTIDGPTHLAYTHLTPNSSDEVTIAGPTVIGAYTISCTFSGTVSFYSYTFSDGGHYTFSAMHPLGTVQLFTNPTTLTAGRDLDFDIVFHAASGLPTPTGQFEIWMGKYYTQGITISSSGATLVQLTPIQSTSGIQRITVKYDGDMNYCAQATNFPLTNPPLSGGSGSGGSGGGTSGGTTGGSSPHATATAQGTPGATVTPGSATATTGDATSTAVGAGAGQSARRSQPGDGSGLSLIAILILIVLAGIASLGMIAGIVLYARRRARSLSGAGVQTAEGVVGLPSVPTSDDTFDMK